MNQQLLKVVKEPGVNIRKFKFPNFKKIKKKLRVEKGFFY